jgi:hypothetical protein
MGYACGEADGTECKPTSIGDDEPTLDLFYFSASDAPQSWEDLERQAPRAKRIVTERRSYDWGDWEFKPSLNYRSLLMDEGDVSGIWRIRPFEEGDEGSPIEDLEIPEGEEIWAVNYCPPCRQRFVKGSSEPACKKTLESVAEHLGLSFTGDKEAFIAAVRAKIAPRTKPTPPSGPKVVLRRPAKT